MTHLESLEISFIETLELPRDAAKWLLDTWEVIQVLDDVADGDEVTTDECYRATNACLVGMPSNPFYLRHQQWLLPALSQMVLKWMASDLAERAGRADMRSYMWRAGYYDVVMLATSLVHGPSSEKALLALSLYGETADEYSKEFGIGQGSEKC